MRKPEHLWAIENVIRVACNIHVLPGASALGKYETGGGGHENLAVLPGNSYFIRKVGQRISRKHDEGEEGIRAATEKGGLARVEVGRDLVESAA